MVLELLEVFLEFLELLEELNTKEKRHPVGGRVGDLTPSTVPCKAGPPLTIQHLPEGFFGLE